MQPTPLVVIEIDDNTPSDQQPFSNDASVWNLKDDFNLHTRTAADTFRAIHALYEARFRGFPIEAARATLELFHGFVDAEEVTWLNGAELTAARSCFPT